MVQLTDEQASLYCGDPLFLRLYAVLVTADSTSYSVFNPEEAEEKRIETFANVKKLLMQNHQNL